MTSTVLNRFNVPWWYKVVRLWFPELCENSLYSPCLFLLSLDWEHTGNAICLYVLSHYCIIRRTVSNPPSFPLAPPRSYLRPRSPPLRRFRVPLLHTYPKYNIQTFPFLCAMRRSRKWTNPECIPGYLSVGDDPDAVGRENELQCRQKNDTDDLHVL